MVIRQKKTGTNKKQSVSQEKEFYADLDRAKKRGCLGCGGCALITLLVFLSIILGSLGIVAASGALDVPVLSGLLYKEDPAPRRIVEPAVSNQLDSILSSQEAAIKVSGGTLELDESDLTVALQDPGEDGELALKRGQIAIDPESAEVYGQVTPQQFGQPVVVRIDVVTDGQAIEVSQLRIGYVRIPLFIARVISRVVLGIDLGSTAALANYGVTAVELGQGTVSFQIEAGGIDVQGFGASLNLSILETIESLGIDPASLSDGLTPETIEAYRAKLKTLSDAEREELEILFPEIERLDTDTLSEDSSDETEQNAESTAETSEDQAAGE